jgi:hypothetical protein
MLTEPSLGPDLDKERLETCIVESDDVYWIAARDP